tara:strand:- start:357 stop:863 length:507 start_codon:yes stop_codon:yes gene_type:complete
MAYKSSMSEREDEAGLNADGNRTNNFEFELASALKEFEDFKNEGTSLIRQQSSSASRSAEKTLKDNYREAINNATNTRDKRELKKERDEKIEDALQKIQEAKDAATEDLNKMGQGDSLKDDSTDETGSAPDNATSNPAGGDDLPAGLSTIDLQVCVNGSYQTVTFVIQ